MEFSLSMIPIRQPLKGLRVTVVNEKETLVIEQVEYDLLLEKTIEFTNLFIKGLKYKELN